MHPYIAEAAPLVQPSPKIKPVNNPAIPTMFSNPFSKCVIKGSTEGPAAETESVHDNPSISTTSSTSWSTYANNGSVASSNPHTTTNPSPSSSATSASTSATAGDASTFAADRIASFIAHHINPNPCYTNTPAEASIAEHIATMTSLIEDFDAIMAGNNAE
ncbi:hypothetical protein IFR05_009083 [Cadophora sp. M221]|nr:hypothetical protein IFR05_009083 [Cadophora sp. M221]